MLTAESFATRNLTPAEIRAAALALDEADAEQLLYDWRFWARPSQVMPEGDWRVWLAMAGRGWGKTKTGVESIREVAMRDPKAIIAIIAPTAADCRDVIIEGESGLLNAFPPKERPIYKRSLRHVQFRNGAQAFTYSAEEGERLRGPQHSFAYADEIAVWPDPELVWDNLKFGLRLGADPRIIATTTPRPSKFLRKLIADPGTLLTSGSSFENARNLPASQIEEWRRIYAHTRIGRQELLGELLEEAEGALWTRARIEGLRITPIAETYNALQLARQGQRDYLQRIVIAVDPSVTAGPESDECGIVVTALGIDGQGYVLADRSGRLSPDDWISRTVAAYDEFEADRIIGESNNGGDLIESLLRTQRKNISYEKVHASRGKIARAEPVAALYEQGKVHHVGGFAKLEDEMTNYVPGMSKSPNRMDALVWGLSYLMLKPKLTGKVFSL